MLIHLNKDNPLVLIIEEQNCLVNLSCPIPTLLLCGEEKTVQVDSVHLFYVPKWNGIQNIGYILYCYTKPNLPMLFFFERKSTDA